MLRVYYTVLTDGRSFDESALSLSAYRREKLAHVKAPLLRKQMLAAEWLLGQALLDVDPETALPPEIQKGEHGKPFFPSLPLHFSLSHSDAFVACALSDYEIGLDVQKNSVYNEPLARRFFSPAEQRYIRECSDHNAAFTEIWCLKESYIKATGEGLSRPLSDFSLDMRNQLCLNGNDAVRFWCVQDHHCHLALCSLNGCDPVPDILIKKS